MIRFGKLARGLSFAAVAALAAAGCFQGLGDDDVNNQNLAVDGVACSVTYDDSSQWTGGFKADVTVKNAGAAALDSWTLTWTFPGDQRIQNAWNARVTQDGAKVSAAGEGWNGAIAAGQSASFGFTASVGGTNASPTDFAVNGVKCNGSGSSSSSSGSGSSSSSGGGDDPNTDPVAGNPYDGATMYINPVHVAHIDSSIALSPELAPQMEKVKGYSTAIWLDSRAQVPSVKTNLDAALEKQKSGGTPVVTTFVIYDLPNRDCAAKASNGELHLDQDGLNIYKTQYIDLIAEQFKAHPDQRIVAIIEPDSLANLATNLEGEHGPSCTVAAPGYREGIAYALKKLAGPNVSMYLDSAHAGWLGWLPNPPKMAKVFKEVLDLAGGPQLIRGFATNVANYTPLTDSGDEQPMDWYQFNPVHDELSLVKVLKAAFAAEGITGKTFLIDTSRNGQGHHIRESWSYWCNVTGAGLGQPPTVSPVADVDAYVWIKPPGDSDGTADKTAARYDAFCGMPGADPDAPEAGVWFHKFFKMLVENANPAL